MFKPNKAHQRATEEASDYLLILENVPTMFTNGTGIAKNICRVLNTDEADESNTAIIGLCVTILQVCKALKETNDKLEKLRVAHNLFVSTEEKVE